MVVIASEDARVGMGKREECFLNWFKPISTYHSTFGSALCDVFQQYYLSGRGSTVLIVGSTIESNTHLLAARFPCSCCARLHTHITVRISGSGFSMRYPAVAWAVRTRRRSAVEKWMIFEKYGDRLFISHTLLPFWSFLFLLFWEETKEKLKCCSSLHWLSGSIPSYPSQKSKHQEYCCVHFFRVHSSPIHYRDRYGTSLFDCSLREKARWNWAIKNFVIVFRSEQAPLWRLREDGRIIPVFTSNCLRDFVQPLFLLSQTAQRPITKFQNQLRH